MRQLTRYIFPCLATLALCLCAYLVTHYFKEKSRLAEEARQAETQRIIAQEQRELEKAMRFKKASEEWEKRQQERWKTEQQFLAARRQDADITNQMNQLAAEQRRLAAERRQLETQKKGLAVRQAGAPPASGDNSELARALESARRANEMTRGIAAPRDASVSARDSSKGGALALAQAKLPKGATVTQTKFYPPGTGQNYWTCYIYFK